MFKSFYTLPLFGKVGTFIIPFSYPMNAINLLMFDSYTLIFGGLSYVVVFTVTIMHLVTYIFQSDTLLTGRFEVDWINRVSKIMKRVVLKKK